MKITSWYNEEELKEIGFNKIGKNCKISKKASIYGAEKISIGNNVFIADFCILTGNINIGNCVFIGAGSYVISVNASPDVSITFEDFTGCSFKCSIIANDTDFSGENLLGYVVDTDFKRLIGKNIVLKKHATLGAHSVVLPGITMAEGSVCGVASCIRKDTKPYSIYMGNPAVKVGDRSDNLLKLEKEFKAKYPEIFL